MEDFFVGAATAAHQVEGDNRNSDFWAMEHMRHTSYVEPSGKAVDHYHRYEEDITLLAEAGLTAYRFSIEWARIEPREGQFDQEATEHYRKVIRFCKKKGVLPIVTLHHFSSPVWLIRKGGWTSQYVVGAFTRYVSYIVRELGSELTYVCTINEANMGTQLQKIADRYKKQGKSGAKEGDVQVGVSFDMKKLILGAFEQAWFFRCRPFGVSSYLNPRNMEQEKLVMEAHRAAVKTIRELAPHIKTGLTLSLYDYQVQPGGEALAQKMWQDDFETYFPYIKEDDFIGVQNYTRKMVGPNGVIPPDKNARLTQMAYEEYPHSVAHICRKLGALYPGEIIVTENGIATSDDRIRCEYLKNSVSDLQKAKADGVNIKGYCCWSLLDNFEWQAGFAKTFGLIAVDRKTMQRYPKESLRLLGSFA